MTVAAPLYSYLIQHYIDIDMGRERQGKCLRQLYRAHHTQSLRCSSPAMAVVPVYIYIVSLLTYRLGACAVLTGSAAPSFYRVLHVCAIAEREIAVPAPPVSVFKCIMSLHGEHTYIRVKRRSPARSKSPVDKFSIGAVRRAPRSSSPSNMLLVAVRPPPTRIGSLLYMLL